MLSCTAILLISVLRNEQRTGTISHGRVVKPYERERNICMCNLDRRFFFFNQEDPD